jgi:hypothetical protein
VRKEDKTGVPPRHSPPRGSPSPTPSAGLARPEFVLGPRRLARTPPSISPESWIFAGPLRAGRAEKLQDRCWKVFGGGWGGYRFVLLSQRRTSALRPRRAARSRVRQGGGVAGPAQRKAREAGTASTPNLRSSSPFGGV